MRKEGINPLTNDGQYADTTYKKAVENRNRENFFHAFCRRVFRLANKHLVKRHNICIIKIVFWDMENNTIKSIKNNRF
nr:MAG TPA: hypothetical protein [Caudoviricetes sp.]